MSNSLTRRSLLATTGLGLAAGLVPASIFGADNTSPASAADFRYCLNTGTIRGQEVGIVREIEIAAEAGYDGIEPWVRDLEKYRTAGGSLSDLKKRIDDAGLKVESAIAFSRWIVDDEAQRKQGLEQARRDMDAVLQIGGTRIAAPPAGATDGPKLDLFATADRYGALLEAGQQIGVIPQVEVWGFSQNLSRLGESVFVAIESGHPDACLLPDVYHVYKGGSDFTGLQMLGGHAIHVFHVNDYPANPPRKTISDRDRVYPGDGVAPLSDILAILTRIGFNGTLSLELFNPEYWKQDPLEVARTGLKKTKSTVQNALPES